MTRRGEWEVQLMLLLQGDSGVLLLLLVVLLAALLLLPWRHAPSRADFSPLLLQLGLARYTCGGKRILLWHDGDGGGGTELEGRRCGNDRCGFAHSSDAGGGGATSKGKHSTGSGLVEVVVVLLLLLDTTSKGEGSRRLSRVRAGGEVKVGRRMR